ncbi:MAG: hypothetical protein K2X32_15330 [Phycisphaerales bacterium]|nr:hypothetical protein [Phycisphaerales bacterium]
MSEPEWMLYPELWLIVLPIGLAIPAIAALAWRASVDRCPRFVVVLGTASALGAWVTPTLSSYDWLLTGATGILGVIAAAILASALRVRRHASGVARRA